MRKAVSVIASLLTFVMILSTMPLQAFAKSTIQARYVVHEMHHYAEFVNGKVKGNKSSTDTGISIGSSSSFAYSDKEDYILGVYISVGTAVNYFSKEEFGSKIKLEDGKSYATEKTVTRGKTKVKCVLIGLDGTYFYMPREYLGTKPPKR